MLPRYSSILVRRAESGLITVVRDFLKDTFSASGIER